MGKREALPIPPAIVPAAKRTLSELAKHGWSTHNDNTYGSKSPKRSLTSRRDALAMLTCWQLALRSAECAKLNWSAIDQAGGRVDVQGDKRGEFGSYLLDAELLCAITQWRRIALDSSGLTSSPTRLFFSLTSGNGLSEKSIQKSAAKFFCWLGWSRGSSHSFRASAAVEAYNAAGLKAAQYLLRHKSPRTTELYVNKLKKLDFQLTPAFLPEEIRGELYNDASAELAAQRSRDLDGSRVYPTISLFAG